MGGNYHQCKLQRVKTILGTSRGRMQQPLAGSTGHGLVRCPSTTVHTFCVRQKEVCILMTQQVWVWACQSTSMGVVDLRIEHIG